MAGLSDLRGCSGPNDCMTDQTSLWWWHSSRAKASLGARARARGGSWAQPSAHPASPGRGSSSGARQALGAGQGTVPEMGSALSKPLQSSGTTPRAPGDRDRPGASPGHLLWGMLWHPPVGAGWQNMTPQPGRDSGTGTAGTQGAKSSGVTQPVAALVGWGEAAHQHRYTNRAVHLAVPMKGAGNVLLLLTGNLQCPTRNRSVPGELGSADGRGCRAPAQPTLPAPGSSGLWAAGLGPCWSNSPRDKHCPRGCP